MNENGRASRLQPLVRHQRPEWLPDDAAISSRLAARDPWLRYRKPTYQLRMIQDLAQLLPTGECRIIDIGAGNGLVGETIAALLPGKSVTGVDLTDNALPDLSIPYLRFDGLRLPFADRSFDCAMLCNMLHHVAPGARADLLREALRVTGGGPLLVKDHLAGAPLDRLRLWVLDVLGNAPRGFMVDATYLDDRQWEALLTELHCVGALLPPSQYRSGAWAWCFPNRLEICFRMTPFSS
jgi:SAM-dependent methyltransferase